MNLTDFKLGIAQTLGMESKFLHERRNGIIYLLVGGWYRV